MQPLEPSQSYMSAASIRSKNALEWKHHKFKRVVGSAHHCKVFKIVRHLMKKQPQVDHAPQFLRCGAVNQESTMKGHAMSK